MQCNILLVDKKNRPMNIKNSSVLMRLIQPSPLIMAQGLSALALGQLSHLNWSNFNWQLKITHSPPLWGWLISHESWPETRNPLPFLRLCSSCDRCIICTRSYQRALLMIRINDAGYMAHSCCSASSSFRSLRVLCVLGLRTLASFEMRPSISLW